MLQNPILSTRLRADLVSCFQNNSLYALVSDLCHSCYKPCRESPLRCFNRTTKLQWMNFGAFREVTNSVC